MTPARPKNTGRDNGVNTFWKKFSHVVLISISEFACMFCATVCLCEYALA